MSSSRVATAPLRRRSARSRSNSIGVSDTRWPSFFFSSRRRHTRWNCDWSSDVCSSDLPLFNYLESHLSELTGPLVVEQFPAGFSNLTYLLRFDNRELVLRRPPVGAKIKTRSEERRVGKERRARWAPDHRRDNEHETWSH